MRKQSKYGIGDIVTLKPGGPTMAIQGQLNTPSEYYRCQWFAGKKLESGDFPADSIELNNIGEAR